MIELPDQHTAANRRALAAAIEETAPLVDEAESRHALQKFGEILVALGAHEDLSEIARSHFEFKTLHRGSALCTGYFQPRIKGALTRSAAACFPIYAKPPDSQFTRKEIDQDGVLAGKALEIAWVYDPVDLYFAHIQGSAALELDDGSVVQLAFAGSNEKPYTAIGSHLVAKGLLGADELSAQSIQRFLRNNPNERQDLLNLNQRYIYFKVASRGPCGTLGTVLTPFCSAALDWSVYTPGALCYVEAALPTLSASGEPCGETLRSFFVINHDTGAAITGAGRIDIFCGAGSAAWELAGRLKLEAKLHLLNLRA